MRPHAYIRRFLRIGAMSTVGSAMWMKRRNAGCDDSEETSPSSWGRFHVSFGPQVAQCYSPKNLSKHMTGSKENPDDHPFAAVAKAIYDDIPDQYDEQGQLEAGEELLTILPNIFAQMGVLTYTGVTELLQSIPLTPEDVFCDIGSGIGNICMQVLGESPCRTAVGVEVIPSRHKKATAAFDVAQKKFPEKFATKSAHFYMKDLTKSAKDLNEEKVTVLFSHSWMFDDELMNAFCETVLQVDSLRHVVTSRPFPEKYKGALAAKGLYPVSGPVKKIALHADWNDASEFYVYSRHERWTA